MCENISKCSRGHTAALPLHAKDAACFAVTRRDHCLSDLFTFLFFFFWWVGYHNALCLITVVSSLFLLFVSSFLLFHTCMNVLYIYIYI